MRREIQFSGFGGQGIILAGYITGKAAALYDHRYATFTQSYGPESRGGACAAEVIISDEEIDYPKATQAEVIVVMSQEAYETYTQHLQESGILIIDEDLVTPSESRFSDTTTFLTIPATRYAERLGRKIVANMVMLGFLTAVTDIVSAEAMRQAIASTVPKGTEDLNLKAFEEGYQ